MASYRRLCTDGQIYYFYFMVHIIMTWHTVTKALLSKRPVVKRAEQPVEQPAASCEQTFNRYQPVVQLVWQPVECLFTRCSRLFNRGCQTAQAVEQPVGQPVECLYTLNVCIQDTAGCPTGGQIRDDLTRDILTMGDVLTGDVMTWRRDVLKMGRFDCKSYCNVVWNYIPAG